MPHLVMDMIDKYYPSSGVVANDRACLAVGSGEIHALVGENGAGKTTLMKILYGMERPDSGTISLDGEQVSIADPAAAARLGIGMVQQHFMTVDDFTVAENIVLGTEPRVGKVFFDRRKALADAATALRDYGFHLDPSQKAGTLAVGERQQLEIVKLLYRQARLLILDEPTSVLAGQEIKTFFDTLRRLRDSGKTIIIITHKVKEVLEISDSVTVMRRGRTVQRLATAGLDQNSLACIMMGTSFCRDFSRTPPRSTPGEAIFEMKDVSLAAPQHGKPALDSVSITVRRNEILGVCGIAGHGRAELEDVISGFRTPGRGSIRVDGRACSRTLSCDCGGSVFGYVPADRMRRGSCLELSAADNLSALKRDRFFPLGILDAKSSLAWAREAIERYSIVAAPGDRAGSLSGGNIQKLILARELSDDADFFLFSDPSWGLDVAAAEFVREAIVKARDRGAGILLLSSDLDETLALADRIAVLYKGRIVCNLPNSPDMSSERLGEYMLGLRDEFALNPEERSA